MYNRFIYANRADIKRANSAMCTVYGVHCFVSSLILLMIHAHMGRLLLSLLLNMIELTACFSRHFLVLFPKLVLYCPLF